MRHYCNKPWCVIQKLDEVLQYLCCKPQCHGQLLRNNVWLFLMQWSHSSFMRAHRTQTIWDYMVSSVIFKLFCYRVKMKNILSFKNRLRRLLGYFPSPFKNNSIWEQNIRELCSELQRLAPLPGIGLSLKMASKSNWRAFIWGTILILLPNLSLEVKRVF